MRKILIVCNRTLNLGGIETSLVKFVEFLASNNENKISLLLADNNGVLSKRLPKNIELILNPYGMASQKFINDIKKFNIINIVYGIYHRILVRLTKHFYSKLKQWYLIAAPYFTVEGNYDCVIAYSTDYSDLSISLDKVNARCKIAFLHSDPTVDLKVAKINDRKLSKFDRIFCVSEEIQKRYCVVHPKSADKACVFYNIIDESDIREKAKEKNNIILNLFAESERIHILTVGRISPEKGQDRIPDIALRLLHDGYNFIWYLIGDGCMRNDLEEEIQKLGLADNVKCLGKIENPFPYVDLCDIYVQPSKSEAYSITVHEARVLFKPIVATDFPGIHEQLVNEKNGLIVEQSKDGLYYGIRMLIDNPDIRTRFSQTLKLENFDTTNEINKIYNLID